MGTKFKRLIEVSFTKALGDSWSTTIRLCMRNGRPNRIFVQSPGAITAVTGFEVQELSKVERESETQSDNSTGFDFFSFCSSFIATLITCGLQSCFRSRPSFSMTSGLMRTI